MTENYQQLLEELKELVPPAGENKGVEYKFQVPRLIEKFEANISRYTMGLFGGGNPVTDSEHLYLEINSVKPILFSNQGFLRELYSKSEPLVETSWIELKVSPKELETERLPVGHIHEISGWKGSCGLTFGESRFGQQVISLQVNSGISRRKKIVEELGLKIKGPYNAGKFVNIKSEKGRNKALEDLRKGFRLLNYSNERFIEVHFPGKYPQDKMPAEKLPDIGEIKRIGLCNLLSLGNGSNYINALFFDYYYPYSMGTWKYPGKEKTEMVTSLVRPPILLESQIKVLDAYGITPK